MKRLSIYIVSLGILFAGSACNWFGNDDPIVPDFEDMEGNSIYNFVKESDTLLYRKFLQILDTTGVGRIVSAYNPYASGYTLFLPSDEAVDDFIATSNKYATLDDLLGDTEFVTTLAKYHVVNLGIDANDFPFGALPAYTLSQDLLTVNFVLLDQDSAYYTINNQSPVIIKNNELSNGFVHVIGKMLVPITHTSYDWLLEKDEYALFTQAAEMTGYDELLSVNMKEDSTATPVSLLIEPDFIYNKKGIFTIQDLIDTLGVEGTDYTNMSNGLNQFVGYHILDANVFLDDFLDRATNYTTYGGVPLIIDGRGLDILINAKKQVFDTIVSGEDTTIIDYIGIDYDASNIISQSGAIHVIDQVMTLQEPSKATVTFHFSEEPLLNTYREQPGEYTIEDPTSLRNISWTGPELVFIKESDTEHQAWNDDYLKLDGDFSITYKVPKIVQGEYTVSIFAHANSPENALVEIYVDGKKLGGLLDLSEGGSDNYPYHEFDIADIEFNTYENHFVEVRALIPGTFEWDFVRFEPVKN